VRFHSRDNRLKGDRRQCRILTVLERDFRIGRTKGMLSRALSLATVTLLIGCFAAMPAQAQVQNLEAGKSPSQIFAGTCNACHKSPRGLLKTVSAGSLPSFLRQHYTTSGEMASLLSSFLVSNGATDTRYIGAQPKPAKDAKSEPSGAPDHIDRFGRRTRPAAPVQEVAKPEVRPDAAKPAADGQAPAQAALERGPDGRKSAAKQKLSKRGKPGIEEPPKTDAAREEPAKGEAEPKGETAREEGPKPSGEPKAESAGIEAPKETGAMSTPVLRADPVPPVTPAPAPSASPAVSAAVSSGPPEPAPAPAAPAAPVPPPAVTASVPPPPPVAPAGPPAPPISQ
jgi:hypothetical protein